MNRLFGDVYLRDEDVAQRGNWVPPVDIFETDGHDLVIKAELPDMTREDIEVTVENNILTLRGEKKLPAEVKEEQFRRIERTTARSTRSFTLPNTVDATKVTRRIQERRADGEAAVPRRSEAADDQRRSRRLTEGPRIRIRPQGWARRVPARTAEARGLGPGA